jgi:hypothetical protein
MLSKRSIIAGTIGICFDLPEEVDQETRCGALSWRFTWNACRDRLPHMVIVVFPVRGTSVVGWFDVGGADLASTRKG